MAIKIKRTDMTLANVELRDWHNVPLEGKGYQCIVTVDGLAATGKGPVCRALAMRSNFTHLDVGHLLRTLALVQVRLGLTLNQLKDYLKRLDLMIEQSSHRVQFAGVWYTDAEIHSREADWLTPELAQDFWTKEVLYTKIRQFCQGKTIVADGREAGTVIFPYAQLKFLLCSTMSARVALRQMEFRQQGCLMTDAEVERELTLRDMCDVMQSQRQQPLEGAIILDGTRLPRENAAIIMKYVNEL
ncbi:(d)CMP kinase [bacterium]|nr:(d)CMP kinase [bacterium]